MYLRIYYKPEVLKEVSQDDLLMAQNDESGLFDVSDPDNILQFDTDGNWTKVEEYIRNEKNL